MMKTLSPPVCRGISYLLIYLTAVSPLHPANENTQVQAGNVPVITIATPNAAGISHNVYQDFNVHAPGAVLNNAIAAGESQLVGNLNANANLNGKAAELIINEVTGGSRSELTGKLEVFGHQAHLMIANPNGITCNGCGFINTPNITLTTGKPQFDQQGALDALEVQKGNIIIGAQGIDTNAQDYVDIISRATELNGKITAKNLALTQGANRVSYRDGSIKKLAGQGAHPTLAVDTKALGGMYANKIRLVANEEGVGVNLANIVTAQNDLTITVDGKVSLGNINTKTDLNVSSKAIDVNDSPLNAGRDITLATHTLKNTGKIVAGKDMRVFADNVVNHSATALIQANDNLWLQKEAVGTPSTLVHNRSGTIKTNSGDLIIRAKRLENRREKLDIFIENCSPLVERQDEKIDFTGHYPVDFYTKRSPKTPHPYAANKITVMQFTPRDVTPEGLIYSGKNAYINASALQNHKSKIEAKENLILTGNDFRNTTIATGIEITSPPSDILPATTAWNHKMNYSGKIISGNNLVMDFKKHIYFGTQYPITEVGLISRRFKDVSYAILAKNRLC